MVDRGTYLSDILGCRLKFIGIDDWRLDSNYNLTYVGCIDRPIIPLPHGIHGLIGVGFSGLDIEVLKFNKDLVEFCYTSLSNCNKLRELHVYENQLGLIYDLSKLYPNLKIVIRKGVQ